MARGSLQKLHKAYQDHARAEERERRAHDGKLYDIGRMAEEAGLFELDEITLKGMLIICAEELPKMRDKWNARGVKASEPAAEQPRFAARATFPEVLKLSKQARVALAAEGLKEIRKADVKLGYGVAEKDQLWSGHVVDYGRSRALVAELGGEMHRLGGTPAVLEEAAA